MIDEMLMSHLQQAEKEKETGTQRGKDEMLIPKKLSCDGRGGVSGRLRAMGKYEIGKTLNTREQRASRRRKINV